MWQRIQTLFLGLSLGLTLSLFWVNIAEILGPDGSVAEVAFREKPLYLYLLIACLVSIIPSILLFKLRILQMRVCMISALIYLGLQVVVVIDFFQRPDTMVYALPAIFPLVSAILNLLAMRNIFLDEAMVRSTYRLRQASRERRKERRKEQKKR